MKLHFLQKSMEVITTFCETKIMISENNIKKDEEETDGYVM